MNSVAIQGIHGSYSEAAARQLRPNAEIVECRDFAETFRAVETGKAGYAVVPVENKIVGEIEGTASVIKSGRFRIVERIQIGVEHVLAGTENAEFGTVATVRSHVEALKQCRKYIGANPRWIEVIGSDTASSVKRIVEQGDPANAAIGSRRAAEIYGAKIIAENIADDDGNWTAFCLIEI